MPYLLGRAISLTLASCSIMGCSTIQSAERQAVRYNSAFSDARNEILLLNILRAKYREPLQFSTISTVTGPMRGNISVASGLEWIFHGASKAATLNPKGAFTFRDPAVTLTPLDSKEFRQGMMKPVEAEYLVGLLNEGWSPDVVSNLVTDGGIKCTAEDTPAATPVWVSAADAAKMLREGGGNEAKIKLVSESKASNEKLKVSFTPPAKATIPTSFCSTGFLDVKRTHFRSALGMVLYLGRNASQDYPYMQVLQGQAKDVPLVATLYRNSKYYVPLQGKSAETLAVLAEVIGFAATNAELNASKPTVTVPTE